MERETERKSRYQNHSFYECKPLPQKNPQKYREIKKGVRAN